MNKRDGLSQLMLTYYCHNCRYDFAITEKDKPRCLYCGERNNFELIKKNKIAPKAIAERLKIVTDRLVDNLKKAYFSGKQESKNFNETEFLKILNKSGKLRDKIQKLSLEKKNAK